ncbi:MAG: hypothetical protein KJO07_16415 [Deltaproteobacteria bacterium]|nr:hypothetical protein [Deltaproteobacteria bacterium]
MLSSVLNQAALIVAAALAGLAGLGWLIVRRRSSAAGVWLAFVATVAGAILVAQLVVALMVSQQSDGGFNEHRWVLLSPWGRVGLALGTGACLGAIILSILGTRELPNLGRRLAIVGCRAGAVIAALVLFLEPAIELRQVAREPNHVAILIDTSASMALRDRQDGPTRLERARDILGDSQATLDGWSGRHKIDLYQFDSDAKPSADLAETSATGRASRIRRALERVRARYDDGELAGMVMISDGLATDSFADGVLQGPDIDFLQSLDTRVHTIFAGREGIKDIAVKAILADEFAFVRTVVRIEAVLRVTGYGHRRIPVTLSLEGQPLRRKWVDVDPSGEDTKVAFEFTPSKVGKFVYQVSTPVAEDEAVAENNSRYFVIRVVRDKFRVLQVAGQPSWDVRALRGMLKQNPNVDLISFFILRTQDDITQAAQNEMSLIPFPTRELFEEQLPSFDLIVLQNFNFRPYGLAPYLANIRDYVQGGGGLVMLGGPLSLSSGGYAGTPVGEILPVRLLPPTSANLLDDQDFKPVLTEAGKGHPVTSLRFGGQGNRERWDSQPLLQGLNLVAGLRKDAIALAVHPKLKSRDGNRAPVIAVSDVGEGRVMVVATDSLWHWAFVAAADGQSDGRGYDEMWETATRWLIRDPELQLLQLSSDRVQYQPEDEVTARATLRGPDYQPLDGATITLRVKRGSSPTDSTIVLEETLETNTLGQAKLELGALDPGVYRLLAEAQVADRKVSAADIFLVREASAELDRSAGETRVLEEIARISGGRYLGTEGSIPSDLAFDKPRVVRVDRSTDVELWSGPWLLLLCLGLLAAEWGLRQRSGYR